MTFYDNHDMDRINADENGFIDAHNWLFTSRGIPVVYYGSEIGFRAGTNEHTGNRDYFGQQNVDIAKTHRIREHLMRIANLRKQSIALQRGLQVNSRLETDLAVFYRVYQKDGVTQTALVALNKSDEPAAVSVSELVSAGTWRDAFSGQAFSASRDAAPLRFEVPAHGVRVLFFDDPVSNPRMLERLDRLQATARRRIP
ncbi:MAG: alpha-glucosidase C-terminal domain-containing protein [Woeseiaceae bacterium]